MSDALAEALASVKHMRSLHFAWDQTHAEKSVWDGVGILSQFVRKSKLMCFMLCGFNTSWEEDIYRFKKLTAEKVDPFVMVYNGNQKDLRLKHFARWVNNRLYKVCEFERYDRWERDRQEYFSPSTNLSFSF